MKKVAINGFGRIGRHFLRQAMEQKDFSVVAVNDLEDIDTLAYLLKYDTVYGTYKKDIKVLGDTLQIGSNKVKFFQEKDPTKLPWKKMGIDIVVEATGVFSSYEKAQVHVKAGAKRVVITAPSKDADGTTGATVLVGVNEDRSKDVVLTSNGSCTTNAASPIISILSNKPGIEKAMLSTVHGYTATQNLVDGTTRGSDVRKGRAAAVNIVPSSTGAATAIGKAIPEMDGRFDGVAFRVPVPSGSIADITMVSKRDTSVEEINEILTKASKSKVWNKIMKVTSDPVVSSDIIGEPYGAIVDLSFTRVVDGNLVKVLSWYDNEYGYVTTLISHVAMVSKFIK